MSVKITDEMKVAIRDAWRKGTDPFDIQDKFNIGRTSMEKIVKGIPSGRQPGQRRRFDYAEAVRMKASGVALCLIAERLGVHESTIRRALRQVAHSRHNERKAAA